MTYTVVWKPSLKKSLADIWLDAEDRAAVTESANRIDRLLRVAPMDQGESRDENVRILLVAPLAVVDEVFEQDRRVDVLAVRSFGT